MATKGGETFVDTRPRSLFRPFPSLTRSPPRLQINPRQNNQKEYVRDVGGNPEACDTKEELVGLAARLAVQAEVAALGTNGNGNSNGNAPTSSSAPPQPQPSSSSISYPEIEYSEQPRREQEGQTTTTTTTTKTTGNPFAPSPSIPPSMPAANSGSPRKRALLIGCNYASTPSATLQGCINDASCLRHLLITRFGFPEENIVLLLDTSPYASQWPTRSNILWHASALSSQAQAGDSLFFSFSGHGAQVPDQSGVRCFFNFFFENFCFLFFFFFLQLTSLFLSLSLPLPPPPPPPPPPLASL